jgi:serine/threonine protein kinase
LLPKHPKNLIALYGKIHLGLVLERMDWTLYEALEGEMAHDKQQQVLWMQQLFSGLQEIHRSGITHRDISPDNILLTRNYVLKIGDFGASCQTRDGAEIRTLLGKQGYFSPETLQLVWSDHTLKSKATNEQFVKNVGTAVDIFGAGCFCIM